MSADIVVGLLTLLGLLYVAWMQTDVRRANAHASDAEAMEFSAEAVSHMTQSLLQVVEKLADRDELIVALRARVEILEEQDRLKTAQIIELEHKVEQLEDERRGLQGERDALKAEVGSLKQKVI